MTDKVLPRNYMKVTRKGDTMKFISYGAALLKTQDFDELIIMGAGSSIEVAVKVSE